MTTSLMRVTNHLTHLGVVVFLGVACLGTAYADPAPVYDVESMPQQIPQPIVEAENNQPTDELPPMPQQDDENTFVPMQQNANKDPAVQELPPEAAAPAAPAAETPVMADASNLSVEQRIKKIEMQMNNVQSSESIARVESLQTQVQTLRGQVEQLNHQLQQIQTQQKAMYSDIDKRLGQQLAQNNSGNKALPVVEPLTTPTEAPSAASKALAAGKALASSAKSAVTKSLASASPSTQAPNRQPNVAEEQQIYQTAYTLIKAKKYSEAVNTLQTMLQKYPKGQFASNAHYWLGELYGVMGKNDQALSEFDAVVRTYPDSPRVSDAQLKVGLIYAAQLKWNDAKTAFKKVINQYPGTTSSRLASEQLKQIKQAGH